MMIARFHSVLTANTQTRRELFIATNDCAGIPRSAEIF